MPSPISVIQHPLQLTASKVDHVYTFASSTPTTNPTFTDFRFVADIYVDTQTQYPIKIARQIFAPNSLGRGIINVQRIIENYVEGNARSEYLQYASQSTSATSPYGTLANLSGKSESNAFSNWNCGGCLDNKSYPQRYGVRDYRIMIGEQYVDPASPSTTIINVSQDPLTPNSGFYTTVVNQPWTGGSSGGNSVRWFEAGGNISQTSSITRGVEYAWTNSMGTVVYAASVTNDVEGLFTPASTPTIGDLFKIEERYTGIRFTYQWFSGGTYIGWGLLSVSEGFLCDYSPADSPPFVTIWPGTSLKQGSYIDSLSSGDYWTNGPPVQQQQFWEVERYRISSINDATRTPRYGQFLTTFGPEERDYNYNDPIAGQVIDSRSRRHHPECPILVSFFSGILSYDTTMPFINNIEQVSYLFSSGHSGNYQDYQEIYIDSVPPGTIGITRQDERIMYTNLIRPDLAGGRVGVWAGDSDLGQWDQTGIRSEFVVYYLDEASCMSDPVHILFLNRQGVFDVYTFDRKALESKKIKRDSYAQGGIQDLNSFSQLSTERRDVIYNQELKTAMNVETWWLSDNDKAIVMDLFQSPEVYIIKNQEFFKENGNLRGDKSYNPYLLPVTVDEGSIKEFKNRYNKLWQYGFKFEYSSINEYRTQG